MADRYGRLRDWVSTRGGWRMRVHPQGRDQLIAWAVEEWPADCPPERLEEVLHARLSRRCRDRYGSVVASLLISLVLPVVIRLIVDWWLSRRENKALMEWWHASANPDVPPPPAGP